jgi:hypothetical protein
MEIAAMSLPRNVQRQVDAANAAQEDFNAKPENPAADAVAPEPVEEKMPEGEAPIAAQPAEDPKPVLTADESRDAAYWRHRFDVLQGKYNAEVPALRKEVSTLQEQIKTAAAPTGDSLSRAQHAVSDLTPEEVEEYGPDLINLIKRVAGQSAQPSDDMTEIKDRFKKMDEERLQDAEARFWSTLETDVSDFRQINSDPAFHRWLSEIDTLTGSPRQTLLETAQQALDPSRAVAIFRQFKGAPSDAKKKQSIPEDQIQPKQSRSNGADVSQSAGKMWTRSEIAGFYRDKAAGRVSPDEANSIEQDIFAAQQEGRIR